MSSSQVSAVPRQPTKKAWTSEEDEKLIELIAVHGTKNWTVIANALPNRIGKQCRERWYNHLDPHIKKGDWTEEEDDIIVTQQRMYGNQWSKITKLLPGRTDNAVKNRWHATARARERAQSLGDATAFRQTSDEKPQPSPLVVDNAYPVYETVSPQVASAYYSDSDLYLDADYSKKVTKSANTNSQPSNQGSGLGWLVFPKSFPSLNSLSDEWVETIKAVTQNVTDLQDVTILADDQQMDIDNTSFVNAVPSDSDPRLDCFSPSQSFVMLCPSPRKIFSHDIPKRHIFSPDILSDQFSMDIECPPQTMDMCMSPPLDRITIYSPESMTLRGIQFDYQN